MSTSVDSHRGAGPSGMDGEDGEPDDVTAPLRRPAPDDAATDRLPVPDAGPVPAGWFDVARPEVPEAPGSRGGADDAARVRSEGGSDAPATSADVPAEPAAVEPSSDAPPSSGPPAAEELDGAPAGARLRRRSRGLRVPAAAPVVGKGPTGAPADPGPAADRAPTTSAPTTSAQAASAPAASAPAASAPAASAATASASRPRPSPAPRPSGAPDADRPLPVGGPPAPSTPKEPPRRHTAALGRLALVLVLVAAVVGTVVVLQQRSQFGRTDVGAEEIPALEVAPAQVDLNTVGQPNALAPPSALLPGTAAAPQSGRAPTISAWANGLAPRTNIPAVALQAYGMADLAMRRADAGCRLSWVTIAGLARIESNHGRYRGATITPGGDVNPRIIGVPLDGTSGNRTITDTDGGLLDGDATLDRAVGPMQFIPSTWARWRSDGNGDGRADPNNIFDAALAAGRYLCAGGRDLATGEGWRDAVLSYNFSDEYGRRVYAAAQAYASSRTP